MDYSKIVIPRYVPGFVREEQNETEKTKRTPLQPPNRGNNIYEKGPFRADPADV